jgi:hypothetical protein
MINVITILKCVESDVQSIQQDYYIERSYLKHKMSISRNLLDLVLNLIPWNLNETIFFFVHICLNEMKLIFLIRSSWFNFWKIIDIMIHWSFFVDSFLIITFFIRLNDDNFDFWFYFLWLKDFGFIKLYFEYLIINENLELWYLLIERLWLYNLIFLFPLYLYV